MLNRVILVSRFLVLNDMMTSNIDDFLKMYVLLNYGMSF
jgi:hypothetical protein